MRERELRKHCRAILRALDLPTPLDVVDLCAQIGRYRHRPLRLVPYALPTAPFGLWVATPASDYIIFQRDTTTVHQTHIVLHELGHILAGHQCPEVDDDIAAALAEPLYSASTAERFPDLAPELVRQALRRESYGTVREREAETVATIILEWAAIVERVTPTSARPGAERRLTSALGDRWIGWL